MSEEMISKSCVSDAPALYTQKSDDASLSIFSDPQKFETALKMANFLADSTVIPKAYQKNPSNCLIAIEMSSRINTSPMMVMQNLYIVNGNPSWSSQWIIAMINNSGRYKTELQFEYGNDKEDDGLSCYAWAEDHNGHRVTGPKITMKMAKEEGWYGKQGSKWKTMPEVMIQYRAASFFGRKNCPDMILGIYSKDEVMDMVGDNMSDGDFYVTVDKETGEIVETDAPDLTPISQEQRQEMFTAIRAIYENPEANNVLKKLINEEGFSNTSDLTVDAFKRVMEKIRILGEEDEDDGVPPGEDFEEIK